MQYKKSKKAQDTNTKNNFEIIYGPHAIVEMLKAKKRRLIAIYTLRAQTKGFERVSKYLPPKTQIQYVERAILDRMVGSDEHGGIVATVSPFKYCSKVFDPNKKPFILLLDSIQDVRNLGAILRSAYCTGIEGVVICKKGGATLTPAVFKTSAGLAEYLDIYCAPSIQAATQELKQAGYNLYMAVLESGKNAASVEYKEPMCLVIGNEATGIARDVQKQGELITIPQRREDISYNASVAAGILMFLMGSKTL